MQRHPNTWRVPTPTRSACAGCTLHITYPYTMAGAGVRAQELVDRGENDFFTRFTYKVSRPASSTARMASLALD